MTSGAAGGGGGGGATDKTVNHREREREETKPEMKQKSLIANQLLPQLCWSSFLFFIDEMDALHLCVAVISQQLG